MFPISVPIHVQSHLLLLLFLFFFKRFLVFRESQCDLECTGFFQHKICSIDFVYCIHELSLQVLH